MGIDLPLTWAIIIGFGLMMYVIMDGFDLGVGILFPFVTDRAERDTMVNSIAPVWDGNETWLVLGGAAMFAAFPLAYSLLLSALYLPLMAMLAGLIWRGVSFEFRFKATELRKPFWDKAFASGSYVAAFSQGIALGAFINGFAIDGEVFVGGSLDCITPFSVFTGLGVVVAYALLGSTWVVMKTSDDLQRRMRDLSVWISIALLAAIVIVSVWTPLGHPQILARWFTPSNLIYFAPVPLLVLVATWLQLRLLQKRDPGAGPFVLSLLIIFLGYSGLAISMWPNIIPPAITIWEAAAPPESAGFALVGTLFVLPFVLMYTTWSYYVFRGKTRQGEEYH
ncbi:cytochrome d ubiquinol oxidase subunit II [Rhizobium ruizarguesonis]|uniref:cytochrome d ubiquinol oxidase subunit II n=1 Tax=Rhizobium ruizarguesonis TaxID=2081791 RepID=UPI00102F9922|nr:cytochrome d ubiquinol oxidase subunit II [Rhizobium ruizarguesonis]TBE87776.1 cytochrome d ubiquinol oxidase subunit II [Rhizobium ruizarguesonis]